MTQQVLDRIVLQPGESLFKEGEYGDRAYVVQEGSVNIVKANGEGEIVLGTVDKGGILARWR